MNEARKPATNHPWRGFELSSKAKRALYQIAWSHKRRGIKTYRGSKHIKRVAEYRSILSLPTDNMEKDHG